MDKKSRNTGGPDKSIRSSTKFFNLLTDVAKTDIAAKAGGKKGKKRATPGDDGSKKLNVKRLKL